ncbi:MAG: methionine--tRNA ligase [Planctomycetota bacterium]|nr:methionine--tRNA ligase [Planctomycetota bacterium]
MSAQRILVTAALPYANGHLHIGHMVEFIQTDIWCRFQRLLGHNCIFVHADDTHGTATMIRARQEGRPEVEILADMQAAHMADLADFQVEQVHYGSTNSEANRALCHEFWAAFREQGLVAERDVEQLFDPEAGMFLADRFVKGTCPRCGEPDQYGDHCEQCNATYSPSELVNPYSTLTGAKPELRTSKHLFVQIHQLQDFLTEWVDANDHLQDEVANYLKGFFLGEPLKEWDISRPAPYFGFEIPDAPGQFWYVWFDAPIGYVSSTKEWCDKTGEDFDTWWRSPDTRIVHVIGKDIIYFHCLFWPAMLKTAGFRLPERVQIHGMLTVDGAKMSKSRGTFVLARTYLEHLDPAYLRYFYASKLTNTLDDFDLGLEEFVNKINSDLVGKVVNLASRTAKFVKGVGLSAAYPDDGGLFEAAATEGDAIRDAYEGFEYAQAMRRIMALADRANEYVEAEAPWALKKDPEKAEALQDVCTVALNLFRQLVIYLAPVLPRLAAQVGELLGAPIERWDESRTPLVGTPVAKFKHLMQRVDPEKVKAMIEDSREAQAASETAAPTAAADDGAALAAEPIADECTYDDFMKIDLRVARVAKAEHVDGAKKLLKLTLSLGGDETRTVFAGIKSAYQPEQLEGRLVVCVANLAPRKMKFGVSEGMVVAAGPGGQDVFLLSPDSGAVPGQRVH